MKNKLLLIIISIFMLFLVTGCGNESNDLEDNNESDNTNEVDNNQSSSNDDDKIDLYSDNTKIVFANGGGKLVYYYSGEKITGYSAYLDYGDSATAKLALSVSEKDETIKNMYTQGRYLVVEYNESQFEDTTVSEIKALYSYLEQVQKSN